MWTESPKNWISLEPLLLSQKSLAGPRWQIWPKGQPLRLGLGREALPTILDGGLGQGLRMVSSHFPFRRHHSWLAPELDSLNCSRTPWAPGNDAGGNGHVGFGDSAPLL